MKSLTIFEIAEEICKNTNKFGIIIKDNCFTEKDFEIFQQLDPSLRRDILIGKQLFLFSKEEEMRSLMAVFNNDTFYKGPLYAVSISNTGELLDENT